MTKEAVNHPDHYNDLPAKCHHCGGQIECIDVVEVMPFNLGNAVKYIWREAFKGKSIEDLKKARWYLDREIAKREGATAMDPVRVPTTVFKIEDKTIHLQQTPVFGKPEAPTGYCGTTDGVFTSQTSLVTCERCFSILEGNK